MKQRLLLTTVLAVVILGLVAWLVRAPDEAPGERGAQEAEASPRTSPAAAIERGGAAGQVRGVVRQQGRGVASASVALRSGPVTLYAGSLEDGRFLFGQVPAGEIYLSAFAAGLASDTVGPLTLAPGQALEEVVLELVPSLRISGTVVDYVTRAPIAGALVVTPAARLRTDSGGRFALVGAAGGTWLEASAPGYRSRMEWVEIPAGADGASLEVQLTTSSQVSGKVLEGGAPVANATVWTETVLGVGRGERSGMAISNAKGEFHLEAPEGLLRPVAVTPQGSRLEGKELRLAIGEHREHVIIEGDAPTALSGTVRRDGQPLMGARLAFVEAGTEQVQGSATSSVDGRFQAPALRKGKYLVQVGQGSFTAMAGPFNHQGDGVPWAVDVQSGGVLKGHVEPPAAGIRVRWRSGDWAGPAAETSTDVQGRFHFEGLPAGSVSVDAEGPSGTATARARAGEDVVLRLARGVIEVRIREEGGGPVSDAAISVRSLETGAVRRVLGVAAAGLFRIEAPPGAWDVWGEVPGRGRTETRSVTVGAEPASVELALPSGAAVGGVVRDAESLLGLQGALVMAGGQGADGTARTAVLTDARGEFRLPSLPRRGYVMVSRDGYLPAMEQLANAGSAGRLEFKLSKAAKPHVATDDSAWQFEGVGMVLAERSGRVVVDGVNEGGPAERGGVLKGDVIVSVDGLPAAPPVEQVIPRIRGPSGTPVRLGFERGGAAFEVVLRRRTLHF